VDTDYLKLLLKYNALPQSERHISIFEVSGYPHYENVCSNVLAFYLHPQKEHKLGCLLLSSLLKLAGHIIESDIHALNVEREYLTMSGGRLDLLITTDAYVIGIENKIFHHLNNNLLDYKDTIDQIASDRLTPVRIVLSLKPFAIPEAIGFANIVYSDLWHEVKANLGFHATSGAHKWTAYLIDFMESTEILAGESMDLTDRDKFFVENEAMVERLVKDRNSFVARINSQVSILRDLIADSGDSPIELERRWIYASSCLVHDFVLSGNKVAFDLYVSPKGWILQLFGRNQVSNRHVAELVSAKRSSLTVEEGRFVIAKWPLATGLEEIKDKLCEWMNWIVQEDANLKSERAPQASC